MSNDWVLVHYMLHSGSEMVSNVELRSNNLSESSLGNRLGGKSVVNQASNNNKIEILGRASKKAMLSQIRGMFELSLKQVWFLKKSQVVVQQSQEQQDQQVESTSILMGRGNRNGNRSANQKQQQAERNQSIQYPSRIQQKYQVINKNGEESIRLIDIFDYSFTINALSIKQNKPIKTTTNITQFYLIHLLRHSQKRQIAGSQNKMLGDQNKTRKTSNNPNSTTSTSNSTSNNNTNPHAIVSLATNLPKIASTSEPLVSPQSVNSPVGMMLFTTKGMDDMNNEMNNQINKNFGDNQNKIKKLINTEETKAKNIVETTNTLPLLPTTATLPSSAGLTTATLPTTTLTTVTTNATNSNTTATSNTNTNPNTNTNTSNVPNTSNAPNTTKPATTTPPQTDPPKASAPSSSDPPIKKRAGTTKQQIQSTLRLAKVTHRSFHNCQQIKQRSIVDFSLSKIELINAYKNFFYEKELILKDQTQAKYLKESLNSTEFNLDVAAPISALDTKIGMALLRSNTLSQESYLHNQSFSQVHIAYSFQQAFQIQPENIMLNSNLKNSFKQMFILYLVLAKSSPNTSKFFLKPITQIPQIQKQLQLFFQKYGSTLESGVFVFGGKYLAETSFKFLQNLDLKSKEKVRNAEGKFTIQGGPVNIKPGAKVQDKEKEQDHIATQKAIVSRSYMLFPGSSKNLTEWNNNLDNSREDWKLILKDTKNIFIGEVLANPLNSQEYKLIDNEGFGNFINKLREYFDEMSSKNKKNVDEGLEEYKRNRLFVLWKEEIIKTLRVIKLTPLKSNQEIKEVQKPVKTSHQRTLTDRRLISEQELKDMKRVQRRESHNSTNNQNNNTKPNFENEHRKEKQQDKNCLAIRSKKHSFYILLRSKQINEAYKNILESSSEYEEKRQIYDSRLEKWFFKYLCCCFFEKKPRLTEMEIKRKKYFRLFADERNKRLLNQNDLEIYNLEIQNQYKLLRQANEFQLPSEIISRSPRIKHIFDISQTCFNEGIIEDLVFRTTPIIDCWNRSVRYEIYFWIQFTGKRKGLINLLQNGQHQHVIIRVQNIKKVNLIGEVIQDNIDQYGDMFYNNPNHQHFMTIEKLVNIGH